jgi:hypothetical protein
MSDDLSPLNTATMDELVAEIYSRANAALIVLGMDCKNDKGSDKEIIYSCGPRAWCVGLAGVAIDHLMSKGEEVEDD